MGLINKLFHKKETQSVDSTKIIALSPNDKLYENKNTSEFSKYENFLRAAFSDENVRNIAITGNHGVGKSSIIRSYESKDKNRGKGYLYISLMDFNKNRGLDFFNDDEANINSEDKEKLQASFEHYLLCQILSKLDSHHFPHSTFRLIPKKKRWGNLLYQF